MPHSNKHRPLADVALAVVHGRGNSTDRASGEYQVNFFSTSLRLLQVFVVALSLFVVREFRTSNMINRYTVPGTSTGAFFFFCRCCCGKLLACCEVGRGAGSRLAETCML